MGISWPIFSNLFSFSLSYFYPHGFISWNFDHLITCSVAFSMEFPVLVVLLRLKCHFTIINYVVCVCPVFMRIEIQQTNKSQILGATQFHSFIFGINKIQQNDICILSDSCLFYILTALSFAFTVPFTRLHKQWQPFFDSDKFIY